VSGALRNVADRIAKSGRLPQPGGKTRSPLERAVEALSHRQSAATREAEPWDDFLQRIGVIEQSA